MRLSKVLEKRATVAIDMGDGESLNVTYRPNSITPELIDRAGTQETSAALVVSITSGLVEAWDLTDEHDKTIPVTAQEIAKLPINFLNSVISAVSADSRLDPTKRSLSVATSSPVA
jgi:hypothetical protein